MPVTVKRVWLTPPLQWGLALFGAIALAFWQVGLFQQEIFNLDGWPLLWQFLSASFRPDFSSDLLQLTLKETLTTLAYAICGTFFSLVLGVVGGILGSEVWWLTVVPARSHQHSPPLWLGIRALLAIPRAIHELIWGLFFVNLWGLDPLTALLAIAIPFGAITAKVFAEILDETPRQPLLTLLSSGSAPASAFVYGLVPLAFLNLISYAFYRFECSIRSAAVLGIIGAGGLGYQILLSLQSLRYEQLWTFFYALVMLNGVVDSGSAWLRQRLGCPSRLDLNLRTRQSLATDTLQRTSQRASQQVGAGIDLILVGVGMLLLIPASFWVVGVNFSKLWASRTWQALIEILHSAFPPDWSLAPQLLTLSTQTVAMSVLAIALATLGGMLLSFPAAQNFFLPGGLLNPNPDRFKSVLPQIILITARGILLLCRAIPAPIWALVALFMMFPGILPGAIALGLHNLGILGRLMAEVIENLDQRPLAALKAQGAPNSLIFLYGILPLSLPRFLAYALYRWEVCMRETVIVGLVGAGGLGRLLTEQLSSFDYRGLVVTLGCFLVLTFAVDWVSVTARRSLR